MRWLHFNEYIHVEFITAIRLTFACYNQVLFIRFIFYKRFIHSVFYDIPGISGCNPMIKCWLLYFLAYHKFNDSTNNAKKRVSYQRSDKVKWEGLAEIHLVSIISQISINCFSRRSRKPRFYLHRVIFLHEEKLFLHAK